MAHALWPVVRERAVAAARQTFEEDATTCCYARSDKSWVSDPAGLRWETFFTFGEATTYGQDDAMAALEASQVGARPAAARRPAPSPRRLPPALAVDGNDRRHRRAIGARP